MHWVACVGPAGRINSVIAWVKQLPCTGNAPTGTIRNDGEILSSAPLRMTFGFETAAGDYRVADQFGLAATR